jgi:glutathione-regulated potassium-efflux system ancillary protein KefF
MIALIYAHPYPRRSRAGEALLASVRDLPFVDVRVIYELYPDFAIDVDAEQAALRAARAVVWQHPLYWYSVPPLLKLWFDKVLALGFAYGEGGTALRGKRCQWVVTTGGDVESYGPSGMHNDSFETFMPPIQQTARFCGMHFCPPLVLHGAPRASEHLLRDAGARFREMLIALEAADGAE